MERNARTEIAILEKMLGIYCRGRHGKPGLCTGCRELLVYAGERLRLCPLRPKPACKDCGTHCFSPEMRRRIKEAMRYAGPRMPLRHPLLTLRHYLGF